MVAQTGDVVGIGMCQQEGVDIEATGRICLEPAAQLRRDIGRLAIGIIRIGADAYVDQDRASAFQFDEGHVAVADSEVGGGCRHFYIPFQSLALRRRPVSLPRERRLNIIYT